MKRLTIGFLAIATIAATPELSSAQERTDSQFLASFRRYWQQLDSQLQVQGNNCDALVARLERWNERVGNDVDSLVAQSEGLADRLSDSQMGALQPTLEPLLRKVADAGVACSTHPRFVEVMEPVNRVLSLGG